jgi:hypothetical protein
MIDEAELRYASQNLFGFKNRPSHRYDFFKRGASRCKMGSAVLPEFAASGVEF